MGAYDLAEVAVQTIENRIKAQIATALANVRTARADPIVTTEVPKEYFQFEMAHVYRAPAVFVIIDTMDIRDDQMQSNHINAMDSITVAVVVEDREKRFVVKKAWRYQAAMMQILHRASLTSADGALRLFSRVKKCSFSGVVNLKDEKDSGAVFRQEMSLELQVDHIENLE